MKIRLILCPNLIKIHRFFNYYKIVTIKMRQVGTKLNQSEFTEFGILCKDCKMSQGEKLRELVQTILTQSRSAAQKTDDDSSDMDTIIIKNLQFVEIGNIDEDDLGRPTRAELWWDWDRIKLKN